MVRVVITEDLYKVKIFKYKKPNKVTLKISKYMLQSLRTTLLLGISPGHIFFFGKNVFISYGTTVVQSGC